MIRLINENEIKKIEKIIDYKISNNQFEKCYVYIIEDIIVGLIDFSIIYNRMELNYIWVDPKYRNKKCSYKLMDYMIMCAKEIENIDNITLEVSVENKIAIELYKKYGFVEVARRHQYYNGIDGLLMIRKFDINE